MYNGKRQHNCPVLISLSVFQHDCMLFSEDANYNDQIPLSPPHFFPFQITLSTLCIVEMFYLCNLTDNLFVLYYVLLPSQVVKIIEVPIVVWYLTTLKHTPAILICQGIDSIL